MKNIVAQYQVEQLGEEEGMEMTLCKEIIE
jgi:hypothetical protein